MNCADLYPWLFDRAARADSTDAPAWQSLKAAADRVCVPSVRDEARRLDGWHVIEFGPPCGTSEVQVVTFDHMAEPRHYVDCSTGPPPSIDYWALAGSLSGMVCALVTLGVCAVFIGHLLKKNSPTTRV